ncbi:MAG: efflux RND transporter periplasmic adaptor subunit [Parabacteroides sp.]|nr:efflux RND transporter periplasmic adaptor subunit [Parabacteroides sp.]
MKTILISVAVLLMTACHTSTPEKERIEPEAQPETVETVEDVSPAANDTMLIDAVTSATAMPNHSSFNGRMIVPPQRHATVTLTMGGTVHSTDLLPGDYVRKGTVLATLENPDFITLQQNYLDAHAQSEYLEAEYHRQERLSSQEAASQKRFQQSKADYLSMKSRLEAAAAQLMILGVSPADLLQADIRPYLEVKSPLNGYVSGMTINLGKYQEAGEPVCEVIDKVETLLCLTAYEKDLDDLTPGSRVQFRVNGMGKQTFEATLLSIGQQVDAVNRSLEVYARVKGNNERFRPGMYVTARVEKK